MREPTSGQMVTQSPLIINIIVTIKFSRAGENFKDIIHTTQLEQNFNLPIDRTNG